MAEVRSGSFNTTGYSDSGYTDHYVFSWELVSQSIVDCTSTIKWSVKGAGGKTLEYWTYVKEKYVTVNGVAQTDTTKVATGNETVAFSGTSVIKHSTSTGKGSFSAECGGAFYYYGSYNSTGKSSWDLPTIARATTPEFSAEGVTLGSNITIGLYPADPSFKHKLTYSVGNLSGQTSGLNIGSNFTSQGAINVNFAPPASLGAQFPNANSTKCTITCYTYTSSGTHIGTTTNAFDLNVPSYTPTGSVALTGVNLLNGAYAENKSSATVNITAPTTNLYGASIKSYSTVIDGKTYTAQSFTTSVLSKGDKKAKVTVTDSRGKSVTVDSSSITVYAYSIPYITSFSLARQTDGTTVKAIVKGGFAAVNNKNSKTIKVTLNGKTETITPDAYIFDNTDNPITFTNVSTDQTFTGTLTLTDSYTTVTKTAVLPTVAVTMDFYKDGNGIAMGKVAESGNLLDVAWPTKVKSVKFQRGTRPTSANIPLDADNYGGVEMFLASNSMTEGKPKFIDGKDVTSSEGYITHFHWDNGGGYDAQLFLKHTNGSLLARGCTAGTWSAWKQFIDDNMCKDYVIEQGITNGWEYTKWNSGKIEMITERSVNFPEFTKQADYLWRSIVSIDLSGYLKRIISGTFSVQINGMVPQVCRHSTNLATAEIVIVTSRSSGAFTVSAPLYIIGKWK